MTGQAHEKFILEKADIFAFHTLTILTLCPVPGFG